MNQLTMYPEHDEQFEESRIAKVDGNSFERDDGWSFFVPSESPIVPRVGMVATFYGKGIGYTVRGLFLDGERVFYRTEAEEAEYREIEICGADAADWLKRWDADKGVWSISMGGVGPGYEQAIHVTVAEVLRIMLAGKYDHAQWSDMAAWRRDSDAIEKIGFENKTIKAMGLSGAQWGAAVSLAAKLYQRGPRAIMNDDAVKDRHIQVCRYFPQSVAA